MMSRSMGVGYEAVTHCDRGRRGVNDFVMLFLVRKLLGLIYRIKIGSINK